MCFVRLVEVFRQAALPRHAVAVAVAIARRRVALPRPQLAVHFLRQRWRGGGGEVEGRLLARCGGVLKGSLRGAQQGRSSEGSAGMCSGALRGDTKGVYLPVVEEGLRGLSTRARAERSHLPRAGWGEVR